MKLILIHGRAQAAFEPVDLKQKWIKTLKLGLDKSNLTLPISEDDIIFPYYGKLLDQLVTEYDSPVENIIQRGVEGENKDAKFFQDFLLEVAENANISDQEIAVENDAPVIERGIMNWEWVHSIMKAIDKKTSWSEYTLKKFTYDVFLYLTVDAIKEKINKEVISTLDNEPCVVLGHSLGSVVSYNILRDKDDLNVRKFITVGSPLGISAIKKYLKAPIKMPECVDNGWYNAYDEGDVVALKALDKKYFNINPSIVNNNDVKNQTDNQHGIEGYLNDKDVALEIYKALTEK